ncbi:transglycosylase SLT domain-containing protein [Gilvimarinus sp. F26214L]|uniref:transglycosylase SLT domain-containing protein n=1 Tax=Gilvimarinus sp. DZF01 TaxID=3461371 RepID=UPI004045DDA8
MRVTRCLLVSLAFVLISGCATSPPKAMDNVCHIFEEKSGWYKAAKKAQGRWGTPIPVTMAFIHQESRFHAKAKPPRRRFLWIFPGPRLSSAYGYPQAKDSTWDWYRTSSGNGWADRDDFADAVDFIGWYNAESRRRNRIAATDAYHLYLAYHEGHGGFERRSFRNKDWLKSVAKKVSARSIRYTRQLDSCRDELEDSGWWPF